MPLDSELHMSKIVYNVFYTSCQVPFLVVNQNFLKRWKVPKHFISNCSYISVFSITIFRLSVNKSIKSSIQLTSFKIAKVKEVHILHIW